MILEHGRSWRLFYANQRLRASRLSIPTVCEINRTPENFQDRRNSTEKFIKLPAWFLHRVLLPIHFGTAGLGSAAAVLELLGYRIPALNFVGFYAAGVESALLIWLSVDKHGVADRAIHEHSSGWLIRIGEILNGPLALILRFFGLVPFAAISFLIGALVSRFGWIAVGKVSGSDPESVFAAERY